MSLVKCRTPGCPHQVREGLRRSWLVKGSVGQDLADGETCWRCRAKEGRERKRDRREPQAPRRTKAVWNGDTWMCDCQFVNDASRRRCQKCKKLAPERPKEKG